MIFVRVGALTFCNMLCVSVLWFFGVPALRVNPTGWERIPETEHFFELHVEAGFIFPP